MDQHLLALYSDYLLSSFGATKATHADVEVYVANLRKEVEADKEEIHPALLTLLKEAEDMLSWDENDLPPREDLIWE